MFHDKDGSYKMSESCVVEEPTTTIGVDREDYTDIPGELVSLPEPILAAYEGMLGEYKAIVMTAGEKLVGLQGLTETAFMKIGVNLPEINTALRTTEVEAHSLSEYFKRESGLLSREGGAKSSDLSRLRHAADYLVKVIGEQGAAFEKMSEMMKRIENLKGSIESIRDFAAEIEMLSLNAAIVAIKAGDEGRALNPITNELKKMANVAIELTDEIVVTSEKLTEKYNIFQEISREQTASCSSDVQNISGNLTLKHEGLQASIVKLVTRLDGINGAVNQSLQSIRDIMSELQVQDIVTQCTDHVRKSLEDATNGGYGQADDARAASSEDLLDTMIFQESVPLLCVQLLDDIDQRLDATVRALESQFKGMQQLLHDAKVVNQGGRGDSSDQSLSDVDEAFREVEDVVMGTASMMQNAASSWEQLWSTAVGLSEMLEILERQFKHLKRATNFHLINIPIKIEVARSSGLAKDGELSQRVDGLADYISNEMKESRRAISQDCDFLKKLADSMGKHRANVESSLGAITGDIDDLLSSFSRSNAHVTSTFSLLSEHGSRLQDLIEESLEDLRRVHALVDQNGDLKADFQKLALMAGKAKEMVLSKSDLKDWQAKNSRLQDTIEKFTVLAHKKIAGDMCDVDYEHGEQEGELIIF